MVPKTSNKPQTIFLVIIFDSNIVYLREVMYAKSSKYHRSNCNLQNTHVYAIVPEKQFKFPTGTLHNVPEIIGILREPSTTPLILRQSCVAPEGWVRITNHGYDLTETDQCCFTICSQLISLISSTLGTYNTVLVILNGVTTTSCPLHHTACKKHR